MALVSLVHYKTPTSWQAKFLINEAFVEEKMIQLSWDHFLYTSKMQTALKNIYEQRHTLSIPRQDHHPYA